MAAERGDTDAIYQAVLVDDGVVDINVAGKDGRTPLHVAAAAGHLEACVLLSEAGGDAGRRDALGMNPVHYAARAGQAEVLGVLLLKKKSSTEGEDDDGGGLLVNAKALGGGTALHFAAAQADHHEVRVRACVSACARVCARACVRVHVCVNVSCVARASQSMPVTATTTTNKQ